MASFGENLRQARQARNITLQDISALTKIGTRALQALEDERFELLPGGIFNKGFVRSYARCVGLDEEKTVAEYMAAAKVAAPETDIQAMSSQVYAARESTHEPWIAMTAARVVGVLAVIVGLGLGALWLKEQRKEAKDQAAAQSQMGNPALSAAPIPSETASDPNAAANATASALNSTSATASTDQAANSASPNGIANPATGVSSQPAATAPISPKPGTAQDTSSQGAAPVEISISATARAWISVRSDGKAVETLTLDPENPESRTRSYKAQDKLTLTVGNPAGLSVTYNGKPAGTLGTVGQKTVITFTPQGIEKQ